MKTYSSPIVLVCTFFMLTLSCLSGVALAMPGTDTETVSGTVKQTMDASGYTYMLVSSDQNERWVAIPKTVVKVGDTVHYYQGMEMKDFTSKTLDRVFPSIIFSAGIADAPVEKRQAPAADDSFAAAVEAEKAAAKAKAPSSAGSALPSGGSAVAIVPFTDISVDKAEAENAYTVGEIFTKAKELDGKKVRIRGKVVKVSAKIMGRNWIHIQDGTGDPMDNSHDLVITTSDQVPMDTVLIFEGVLAADKDFGAGYKYRAIVEEAKVVK